VLFRSLPHTYIKRQPPGSAWRLLHEFQGLWQAGAPRSSIAEIVNAYAASTPTPRLYRHAKGARERRIHRTGRSRCGGCLHGAAPAWLHTLSSDTRRRKPRLDRRGNRLEARGVGRRHASRIGPMVPWCRLRVAASEHRRLLHHSFACRWQKRGIEHFSCCRLARQPVTFADECDCPLEPRWIDATISVLEHIRRHDAAA